MFLFATQRLALFSTCIISLAAVCAGQSYAADLKVVVTTKPVHSLVTAVMEGVGQPRLLVEGSASPHTFSLTPSGATAINSADVFIRVSGSIEPFTQKLSAALPSKVRLVTLVDAPDLMLLDKRTGSTFEADGHNDHGHSHGHGKKANTDSKDGHVWLDTDNAKRMGQYVAKVLAERDPANAPTYAANAGKLSTRIDQLSAEISAELTPLAGLPFIVFHDAYQYFENKFGVRAVGSVTVSPDVQPSAKRLTALRAKIGKLSAACVFAEPAFNPKLVTAVTEGTKARSGTLDPEGLSLEPGAELYFKLMRQLSFNLATCLKDPA